MLGPFSSGDQIHSKHVRKWRLLHRKVSTIQVRYTALFHRGFVVKYGPVVLENDGYALLLVDRLQDVPAPSLHAMNREGEKLSIIMQ